MNTIFETNSFLRAPEEVQSNSRFQFYSTSSNFGSTIEAGIRYAPVNRRTTHSETKQKSRVLRRMSGFLMEIRGKNALVTIVENGESFQYDMPADRFRKCGIEVANQPLQMDEIEVETTDGLIVGYRFRPLATVSDAYSETLNLDEERKRKRDLILKKFAKAKT